MAIEEDKPSTAIEPTIVFNIIFTLNIKRNVG
jgi:hypothetical protein